MCYHNFIFRDKAKGQNKKRKLGTQIRKINKIK